MEKEAQGSEMAEEGFSSQQLEPSHPDFTEERRDGTSGRLGLIRSPSWIDVTIGRILWLVSLASRKLTLLYRMIPPIVGRLWSCCWLLNGASSCEENETSESASRTLHTTLRWKHCPEVCDSLACRPSSAKGKRACYIACYIVDKLFVWISVMVLFHKMFMATKCILGWNEGSHIAEWAVSASVSCRAFNSPEHLCENLPKNCCVSYLVPTVEVDQHDWQMISSVLCQTAVSTGINSCSQSILFQLHWCIAVLSAEQCLQSSTDCSKPACTGAFRKQTIVTRGIVYKNFQKACFKTLKWR
jgi:hypothetical protein